MSTWLSRSDRFGLDGWFAIGDRVSTAMTVSRAGLLVLIAAFAVVGAAGVTLGLRVQSAIYLVGMVAVNLPHGGYEHFTNLRRRAAAVRARYVGAYLALVAGFVVLLVVTPVVGLMLAIAVACAKGGLGGVRVLDATVGTEHLRTRPQRLLAAAVRGGAVMIVPIVVQPGLFHAFSAIMVDMWQPGALVAYAEYFRLTRPLFGVGFAGAALAHVGLGYLRGGGHSWLVDALETGLLTLYFAVVPVVVAVGLYFPLWYSTRQLARHVAIDRPDGDGRDLLAPDDAVSPGRTALRAWVVMIGGALATAAVIGGIWLLAPHPLGRVSLLPGLVAFWSIAISVIALPHVVVGSVLDTDQGIWYVP